MSGFIIAATRGSEEFESAVKGHPKTIFLLDADVSTIGDCISRVHEAGKSIFVHVDTALGLSNDKSGLSFLSELGADGIISTRASVIKNAMECGLKTVHRFFVMDSRAVDVVIRTAKSLKPDMIEIMPGVIPKIIRRFSRDLSMNIIAGGLIETRGEMDEAMEAGAMGISTSKSELWSMI